MKTKGEIRCRLFVPTDNGYRKWEELGGKDRERLSTEDAERLGAVLNEHFSRNREVYQKVCT